jgi:predicted CXXCH cytochrome family protein
MAALVLIAGCSHLSNAVTGQEQRAKVQFERIPDMEAAHVANPHDYKGAALCQRCHVSGEERLSVDPIALCSQCHDPKRMKHPYRVAQPTGAEGLPLMPGRLIACHTCHDPHDVKKFRGGLRAEYVSVCTRCHTAHRPLGEAGANGGR